MVTRSTRLNLVLSALFILAMGACGSVGGCGACAAVQPLPGGALPASQTIEGGAQVRVTPHGFATLTSVVRGLLDEQLAGGVCLPGASTLGFGYCRQDQDGCSSGCRVTPALNTVSVSPVPGNPRALRAHVDAQARATVPLSALGGHVCDISVTLAHLTADVDVSLDIDPATGVLAIHAQPLTGLSVGNPEFEGCSIVSEVAEAIERLFRGALEDFLRGQLSPAIQALVDGFLPPDLGVIGKLDVGNLLDGLLPGVDARLETRMVLGGYAQANAGGLSLGMITGFNADRDPATRLGLQASEPALCVPALPLPDLAAAGLQHAATRPTFAFAVADPFNGVPASADPDADVAMGISKTTLNLAGHHLVASGALCLGIGTSLVSQLNASTIGLLVPSLGELASERGNDPMLLVTRPQRDLRFALGDNTEASPAVTIGLDHLEVDFYVFAFERYVRAFTLDLTMNVGVNIEIEQVPGASATIQPTLAGLTPENVTIAVLNGELIRESPEHLEAVLPSVFSLIMPLLGDLPAITVPSFAGFMLQNPSIHRATSRQDEFLALHASLVPGAALQRFVEVRSDELGGRDLAGATGGAAVALNATARSTAASTGRARLVGVATPGIDRVRGALLHGAGGQMPRVTFEADTHDAGRELEWTYQLDGGMWRTWRAGGPLAIEDPAFAWQGKYTIGLKSRVKGDYHTVSTVTRFAVIIDSVAPRIAVDKARWNGDVYAIPAFDIVSEHALEYAFGTPGSAAPASAWQAGGTIELARDAADAYLGADGTLTVFAKDEAGNIASARVALAPGQPEASGCSTGSAPGGVVVVLAAIGLVLGRRRRTGAAGAMPVVLVAAAWLSASLAVQAGCGENHPAGKDPDVPDAPGMMPPGPAPTCEITADCSASACARGELPFCIDGMCLCSGDVPSGRIGPYSDVAVAPDGTIWVSAYAQSHGDLVIAQTTGGRIPDEAWQWIDGVPAGPVAVPDSKIRGGIADAGTDVGMYTSIAVAPDGTPMVSYFDRDTASLKLAQRIDGAWRSHVVAAGSGAPEGPGERVGMYTSLTLRSDDGRPGIAYLAHVSDASGSRAEVRFASAQSAYPRTAGDWQTWIVDSAALPPEDPANPEVFPLPGGLGLFVDAARQPNQAPVVAYYDRGRGELKLARFSAQAGQFAAPRVLDGAGSADAGWSPSVAVDGNGVVHVAYAGATAHDLRYVNDAPGAVPQVIDSGYRITGTTADGLPKPEFHFVGDDASLVLPPDGGAPLVVYQDATTQELLLGRQQPDHTWSHASIAGATDPWPGGYGFFAASALGKAEVVMSTWVVNVPAAGPWDSSWVEVFRRPLAP